MPGHRASLIAVALAASVALMAGCAEQQASPASTPAQQSLRPPVTAESEHPSTPVGLEIDGDSAPTDPVATDAEGTLLPPTDIGRLGWWVDSSLPGSGAGTIVVAGHVDDIAQGEGYAARFADLSAGDTVTLVTASQKRVDYRVTSVIDAQKHGTGADAVPYDELNRQTGPETLALVTCGGPFVGPPLGYRDNIIAFASPT